MQYGNNVQACITAVGFAATVDELSDMVADNSFVPGALTDIDTLLLFHRMHRTSWTAPRWMTAGDVLFFYHTRSARENVARLRRQVSVNGPVPEALSAALERAQSQAAQFARTIFACAEVSGRAEYEADAEKVQHFKSTIYAPLGHVHVFPNPLPIEVFTHAVTLSTGGTLTPVHGDAFTQLKTLLSTSNSLPLFLRDAVPGATGFRDITPDNWPAVVSRPACLFLDESQLRAYLLNFLLAEVKDPRSAMLEECECYRSGRATGIADYFIRVHGQWIPVEAKLNVQAERDLPGQVQKYINIESFRPRRGLSRGRLVYTAPASVALVADQAGIYVLVDGEYVGCSSDRPVWPRTALSHGTALAIRARLAEMSEAAGDHGIAHMPRPSVGAADALPRTATEPAHPAAWEDAKITLGGPVR